MKRRAPRRKSPGKRPTAPAGNDTAATEPDPFGAGLFEEPDKEPAAPAEEVETIPVEPEEAPVEAEIAPEPEVEAAAAAEPAPEATPEPERPSRRERGRRERPGADATPSVPDAISGWVGGTYRPAVEKRPERRESFATTSDIEPAPLYVPEASRAESFETKVGWPGQIPYTRGVQPTMYRGRLWTMRQYAGFTSARATNERFRYLLEQGQTGLSVAFDLPTQIGYDSDDPMAEGEIGKVGVPIDSLRDMEILLEGIPLAEVSTSMTINATAPILLAMYMTVAKKQSVPFEKVRGTLQNDILKEFAARGTYRFPVEGSLQLVTEVLSFCAENAPLWNPISISGYHMREAGCTAAQEIAFTLANGIAYVERAKEAGLGVDAIAGRLSFFFAAHNHLFEEVAKFRAARRLWARLMTERLGAEDPRSARLRFHTQTGGSTLTSQQPENNVARVTIQALAAVLGGTQSLHTNSRDEALGLPTEGAARTALRTQQILAHESGVADVVDPLGGSPYVEALTDELEARATAILKEIDGMGGAVEAIRMGWIQDEIHRSAYRQQQALESGDAVVVGVNKFEMADEPAPEVFRTDDSATDTQLAELREFRESRNDTAAQAALDELEIGAAWGDADLMTKIFRCVESYCTVGEICGSLEGVLGKYGDAEEGR